MKPFLSVFLRVNNRKRRHRAADFIMAGYPMEEYGGRKWKELHDLCQSTFRDGQGRQTYIWFGHQFFFLTEEDAHVFRSLQYLV